MIRTILLLAASLLTVGAAAAFAAPKVSKPTPATKEEIAKYATAKATITTKFGTVVVKFFPDLAPLHKDPVHLQWKMFPAMAVNPAFSDQVAKAVPRRDAPVLFLCRSGQRSRDAAIALTQRGYTRCYNITDGFEGPPDASGHRGTVAGWKVAGLPWKQP